MSRRTHGTVCSARGSCNPPYRLLSAPTTPHMQGDLNSRSAPLRSPGTPSSAFSAKAFCRSHEGQIALWAASQKIADRAPLSPAVVGGHSCDPVLVIVVPTPRKSEQGELY